MLFTSGIFLYWFLPAFLAAYYLAPSRWRTWVITLFSYVFYGWWRPDFVLLVWISTLVDFASGRGIERDRERDREPRRWVWLSCVVNLGLLGYFKYANFGIDSLNAMLEAAGREPIAALDVVLPVGISFYTFQTLSYTLDVYRKDARAVERFGDFACYVSMFPQLVAGPIVRYRSIAEQLRERTHTWARFSIGALLFQAGLAKKALLADSFAPTADAAFEAVVLTPVEAWIGALAYTFQIYFDFSGYSDMAIGLGLMIGFRFPINFDRPYASQSITEFWRRWHISLSSFLRDYLYLPLGGNRLGALKTYRNLALTMLLGGLWHGAAWNFVAWGAYQGFWLIAERLCGKRALWSRAPAPARVAATFVIVVFGWVLFRAPDLTHAVAYMGAMVGVGPDGEAQLLLEGARLLFAAGVVAVCIVWGFRTSQEQAAGPSLAWVLVLQIAFGCALLRLHDAANVPFLYFQF